MGSWIRGGHQKDQVILRSLKLSSPFLHTSERAQWQGWSPCLCDEASQLYGVWQLPGQVREHGHVLVREAPALRTPQTSPMYLFAWLCIGPLSRVLYDAINWGM